jgi:flagellar basal-body rod modification protein FlgD
MAITSTASTSFPTGAAGQTPQSSDPAKASGSLGKLSADLNSFLKLLTVQLQNQDPTQPMDTEKLTQQLVQFSGVEQQIQTNSKLDSLINQNKGSQIASALGYIGKDIEYVGSRLTFDGKTAKSFAVNLPEKADNLDVLLVDEKNQPVRRFDISSAAGLHDVRWDGKNDKGEILPSGTYRIVVAASTGDGKEVTATTLIRGTVTGVEGSGTQTLLNVDDRQIDLAGISRVFQAGA